MSQEIYWAIAISVSICSLTVSVFTLVKTNSREARKNKNDLHCMKADLLVMMSELCDAMLDLKNLSVLKANEFHDSRELRELMYKEHIRLRGNVAFLEQQIFELRKDIAEIENLSPIDHESWFRMKSVYTRWLKSVKANVEREKIHLAELKARNG